MSRTSSIIALCSLALAAALPQWAWAHAFLERAEPTVGAEVHASPRRVRIWFDAVIEPGSSTLWVLNERGQQVNKGKGRVNTDNPQLLEVRVPPLLPGVYRVVWSVVTRDGHLTRGDYHFTVKNK